MKKLSAFAFLLIFGSASFAANDKVWLNRGERLVKSDSFSVGALTTGELITRSKTVHSVSVLNSNQSSIDLSRGDVFITAENASSNVEITSLTKPSDGHIFTVVGGSNTLPTKIVNSGIFKLTEDFVASNNNTITLLVKNSSNVIELSRSIKN